MKDEKYGLKVGKHLQTSRRDKLLRVYSGRFVKLFDLRQDTNSQIPTDSTLQTVAKTKSCRRFQCTEIL